MTSVHDPESTLQEVLATKPRPQKLKNLRAIHDLCRAHYDTGSRDFSINTIGKLCEKQGLLKARGLYNGPAADYRKLIEAWGRLAGPAPAKSPVKALASDEYVDKIDDPAIRMLVRTALAERNKLRAQLNTLKSATKVIVDRRPVESGPARLVNLVKGLTESERDAIRKAISATFLERMGWEERKEGQIVNEAGRPIFDPGFATGLRKLVGD